MPERPVAALQHGEDRRRRQYSDIDTARSPYSSVVTARRPPQQPFATQSDRVLLRRAEAWCTHGYLAGAQESVEAAHNGITVEPVLSSIKMLEQKFAGRFAAIKPDRPSLEFPGPVQGKASWNDSGQGFEQAKDVVLDDNADVTIKAGFLLDGGDIEVHKAQLHLRGTPTQPVIFRHVTITAQNGANIECDNTVFIDCTFRKPGHDKGRPHATKWTFTNCMLYRTRFASLSQSDYGLKMTDSACVECIIPEREVDLDMAAAYTGKWDQITGCLFYRTRIAPSALWMTSKCNVVHCAINNPSDFKCKSSSTVTVYAPESDPMIAALRSNTFASDVGEVRYSFSRKPFDLSLPAFWPLLPAELPDSPRDRK